MEKIYHASNQKKARESLLISYRVNFKAKKDGNKVITY